MAIIVNPFRPDHIIAMTGEQYRFVVRDIGDWNIDILPQVNIAHGVALATIIAVFGYIRNDADTKRYQFSNVKDYYNEYHDGGSQINIDDVSPMIEEINATNVVLNCLNGGFFDHVDFSSTPYNRGKLIIQYED